MALSDKQISQMWSEAHNDTSDRMAYQVLARAIEAEVKKQDTALIRQMLETFTTPYVTPEQIRDALDAARARLEGKA